MKNTYRESLEYHIRTFGKEKGIQIFLTQKASEKLLVILVCCLAIFAGMLCAFLGYLPY